MSAEGSWSPPPLARLGEQAGVPRKNGELVFEQPWEGRAFGLVVALHETRCYVWDEFKDRLIEQVAHAEAREDNSSYYERWLAAFESLLADKGLVAPAEVEARAREIAAMPPDHD